MCGIIGSFDKNILFEGIDACRSRGDSSISLTTIDSSGTIIDMYKHAGTFSNTFITDWLCAVSEGLYMLVHTQAPTNGNTPEILRVHPASKLNEDLWHNGILKGNSFWDTMHLLDLLSDNRISEAQGSFACVYRKQEQWTIFRNSLCPLFVDEFLNICSVHVTQAHSLIVAGIMYNVDFADRNFVASKTFLDKNTVYFIPEAV